MPVSQTSLQGQSQVLTVTMLLAA